MIGNAGSILAFRLGAEDAPLIAAELGIDSASALTDTANYAAWAKLTRNGVPDEPRHLNMLLPDVPTTGSLAAVRNRTWARYTRPRQGVEAKIARFLSAA